MKSYYFKMVRFSAAAWLSLGMISFAHAASAALPSVSSGTLQLWLKADAGVTKDADGKVSQWNDQSANLNNAIQTEAAMQPLLVSNAVPVSAQAALRFDGVQSETEGDYLQGSGLVVIPAGYTSFLVYKKANPAPVREQVPLWAGATGVGSSGRGYYIRSGFGGVDDEMSFAAWANDYGSGFSIPTDTWRIWTDRISDDLTQMEFFDTDGKTSFTTARTLSGLQPPAEGYYVGGLGSQTRNFQGDIAEIIYYQGALSDADRAAVENYLTLKYLRPAVAPFVTSTSPTGRTVRTNAVIAIQIQDNVTQLAPSSVQLFVNDKSVTPTVTKASGSKVTLVQYDPAGALIAEAANRVRIVFGDTSSPPIVQTNEFSFGVISDVKAMNIINIDINGVRNNPGVDQVGGTFTGQGAAGGGETFNGLLADSRQTDGSDNDALTVSGSNLQSTLGTVTTVSFTLSPVGGRNGGASPSGSGSGALINDYAFVGNFSQTSGTADFTISGLGAIPSADLYFYVPSASPAKPITIPGATPATFSGSGEFTSANTVFFAHVPVTGGSIKGTLAGANAALSGLTLMKPLPQPYVLSVSPTGRGVKTTSPIVVQLLDYVSQVLPASIQLFFNGGSVTPVIDKPAGSATTTVSYSPPGGLSSLSTNSVKIIFGDNSSPSIVQSNEFTFVTEQVVAGQQSWSAAGDYSLAANPNGTWSYGSVPATGGLPDVGRFTLYTDATANGISTPLDFWHTGAIDPNVSHNPTLTDYSNFGITWHPGQISLGAGSGMFTAVRWIAPTGAIYGVSAAFADNQTGGDATDVYIYRKSDLLLQGSAGTLAGSGTNYTGTLALAAGDSLYFVVGPGADGDPNGNNTALDATIKTLPNGISINFHADDATQTLDPTDTAGVIALANWNNVPAAMVSVANLVNAAGVSTPTSLQITSDSLLFYQATDTAPPGGDKKMMAGHIYTGPPNKIDVVVTGLDRTLTSGGYDVYVYFRSGSGAWQQSFSILDSQGATNAGPATVLDSQTIGFDGTYVASDGAGSAGHYYRFSNLRLPAFTLEAVPVVGYAYLSGLQIVQSPPPTTELKISIERTASNLILSWTGSATLQSADTVGGTWKEVPGAKSPQTVTPTAAHQFYRLKQ
jgi:hypothetical protein